jgi:hypothetical protein
MARDTTNTTGDNAPAYSEVGTPADATGERSAENTGDVQDATVTEAQATEADKAPEGAESTDQTEADKAKQAADQRDKETAEAAQKQAEEDAKARQDNPYGVVGREANPDVGGESFPTFAPKRD